MRPFAAILAVPALWALEPVPDKLVVLTFDDSVKSHATVAAPLLRRLGFGATFFITEGFAFAKDKTNYMTWEEIRGIHDQGFEIGNHTRDHMGMNASRVERLEEQLSGIDERCVQHGIPKPVSFAWPGNAITPGALAVLAKHGIRWGRRGVVPEYATEGNNGIAYQPGVDHPLLIPSAGVPKPGFGMEQFLRALDHARDGNIAVLQFHGVPEGEHPWVHTPRELFEQFMEHLHQGGYRVIAVRDLARYVDPARAPDDPFAIIERRKGALGR